MSRIPTHINEWRGNRHALSLSTCPKSDYTAIPDDRSHLNMPLDMKIDHSTAIPHLPLDNFDAAERAYIRRELDEVLSTLPAAADGFMVRTRKTGANAGNPKIPPAGQSLVERGLMRLEQRPSPRLFFTEAGWAALKRMMSNPQQADRKKFAHIRQELGIE
jgi:hypothetical protein